MSAVPRQPIDNGYVGLRMTAGEFLAIGETEERLQLIDGVVVMSPRPTGRHQNSIRLIQQQLERYLLTNPGAIYFVEVDLKLSDRKVYTPDLACYRAGRDVGIPDRLTLPPDLIIEVLSPGNKAFDLTKKKDDYESFGIGEYWAFDPADGRLRVYTREGDSLLERAVRDESVPSAALPDFTLDLRPLRSAPE